MTFRAHTGKLAAVAVLTLLLSLASSSTALGQESAKREYNPPQSFVASGGGSGDDSSGSADSVGSGSLPFTGLDLGLAAGGALLLIGAGAALATVNGRRRVEQS